MIARLWRGQATHATADAYFHHVTETVFPSLKALSATAAPGCSVVRSAATPNSLP
jgi:hypothetical protein